VILNDHARVSGNTAEWQAGGISTADGSLILNDFAQVNDNASGLGGGIIAGGMIGGTVTLNDFAQVNGNTAVTGDGLGGGIYLSLGTLTLNDSAEVSGNRASVNGGGIYRSGGRLIGATNGGNVHDNEPNDIAPFDGAQPATGRTATSLEIGGTSVLVILDPGSCSFAGAGMVRFPPYPEWVTLIAVTPAGSGQELLTIRPTTARHLVGEAVEGATLCAGG